ncbi:MAG: hypothetical protein ABIJ09_23215 [Pseudomonadota bacterium]
MQHERHAAICRCVEKGPSREAWSELTALLGATTTRAELEQLIDPVRDRLDAWPSAIRTVPLRWLHEPKGGHPALSLCKVLRCPDPEQPDVGVLKKKDVAALRAAVHLDQLEHIEIGRLSASGAQAREWSHAPQLSSVGSLSITGDFRKDALEALSSSPSLVHLTSLRLAHCRLRTPELEALLDSPLLAHLDSLDLSGGNFLDASDMQRLARCERLQTLCSLRLSGNKLTSAGLAALLASTHLTRVSDLFLSRCAIDDEAAACFESSSLSPSLRRLDLASNAISPGGLQQLVASTSLAQLRTLVLRSNPLRWMGPRTLAHFSSLDALEELDLSWTPTSDLYDFTASGKFKHLKLLNLAYTEVSLTDIGWILSSSDLVSLKRIVFNGCDKVFGRDVEEFPHQSSVPLTSIRLGHRYRDYEALMTCLKDVFPDAEIEVDLEVSSASAARIPEL